VEVALNAQRLFPISDVEQCSGLDRSTIYRRVKAGTFPAPVQIGPRRVAWTEDSIVEWQRGLAVGVRVGPSR